MEGRGLGNEADVNWPSSRTDFFPDHPLYPLVSALTQRSCNWGGCPSTGLLVPVLGKVGRTGTLMYPEKEVRNF